MYHNPPFAQYYEANNRKKGLGASFDDTRNLIFCFRIPELYK